MVGTVCWVYDPKHKFILPSTPFQTNSKLFHISGGSFTEEGGGGQEKGEGGGEGYMEIGLSEEDMYS